jgi:hypothetical protein
MGVIFHQQYFENQITDSASLHLGPSFPSETKSLATNMALRVTEPLPSGRDYLRYFAFAVRNFDPVNLTVGGYVLGTQGAEPELREFGRTFTALPVVPFTDVFSNRSFLIRSAVAEGKRWFYAVNLTAEKMTMTFDVTGGPPQKIVTGEPLPLTLNHATVTLLPYELTAFNGPLTLNVAIH